MQQLLQLYREWCGKCPTATQSLPKAGSNRHYVRLGNADGTSVIGVISSDTRENRCFIHLSRHFRERGLPVPEILAISDDARCYHKPDLGSLTLYKALARGREAGADYDQHEKSLIAKTIRLLAHIQVTGAEGLDADRLLSPTRFDEQAAMFDLNYFKYCFLRTTDMAFDEIRLEADLQRLATDLVGAAGGISSVPTFLYRDFQARNVVLCD